MLVTPQGFLDALAVLDVGHDTIPFDDVSIFISQWQAAVQIPSILPIRYVEYSGMAAAQGNAEGAYRWFLSRAEAVRGANGAVLYWIGINLDMEERKPAERELRDIVDTIPAIVWVALPDGSNTYVTAGSGWRAAAHPDDLQRHEGQWRASVASNADPSARQPHAFGPSI